MQHFSLLDLSAIGEGQTAGDALRDTQTQAQLAERAGYHRYWLAEHHNMPGIASAATAVVIGQVAAKTTHMRIGAGGIMLPNHAPLMVAEAFGTLACLFPDRIDLGLGRAPGTDPETLRALRRYSLGQDHFAQDVQELLGYFANKPASSVRAVPGQGTQVPTWILGSSLYGAQLAAQLGLPYAFASHFAPAMLAEALTLYRRTFKPSIYLDKPYAIVAAGVCVADSDEQAAYLRTSQMLAFARLRTGQPGKLPLPVDAICDHIAAPVLRVVEASLGCSAVGSPASVAGQLRAIVDQYHPDELMVTGMIHDLRARLRSFELAADVLRDLCV